MSHQIEDDPGIIILDKTQGHKRRLWHDCWEQEWDDTVRFAAVALDS